MSVIGSPYKSGSMGNPLGWLIRVLGFRRDNRTPALMKTLHLLDRMIKDLDATYNRMEKRYEDLSRKAKDAALRGDRDNHNIFLNEMNEISKFLALVFHAKKSLMQIKIRLETMVEMGDTFDLLPEILAEISNLKPLLARVTPDILDKMAELEKSVASILSETSIPNLYGTIKPKKTETATKVINLEELLPPKKPIETRVALSTGYRAGSSVSKNVVKKWLLEEIMITNGFLDIEAFVRKYNVSKEMVLEALSELSREGRIILKR